MAYMIYKPGSGFMALKVLKKTVKNIFISTHVSNKCSLIIKQAKMIKLKKKKNFK